MSKRLVYANAAAILTDWVLENGGEQETIDFLAAWIADGKSLREMCDTYALTWGVLAAWIRQDKERNFRYQQALIDRKAFQQERLLDGWWETANLPVDAPASHGDVHKARDSLAKTLGMYSDKQAVEMTVKYVAEVPEVEPDAETWAKKYAPLPVISTQ